MIQIDLKEAEGIAVVRPESMTGLTEDDIKKLRETIDAYLKNHDSLRGLVIVAEHFPGWADFKAFTSHFEFVRDHQKHIQKVAVVSDSPFMSAAPHLIDHFVSAKVRTFDAGDLDEATSWAATEDPRAGHFEILDGFPDDVIAFRAEGEITREDYEETLIPLAQEKIKAHKKIKLLYWIGEGFKSFSSGAMWDDARFGMTHLGDFSKVAVVSDVEWVRMSVKAFAPLLPAPVQVFHNAEIDDAKKWISEG